MARKYYKKKKYYKKSGYYPKPYNKTTNSLISRAWRSIREANKSNTQIDFAFKINYAFNAFYKKDAVIYGDGTDVAAGIGVAALNIYHVLLKSENFRNMMKNYDQVKINGVTCRLNVTDASLTLANAGSVQSINVVTGWDKTGLSVVRALGEGRVGDAEFYTAKPNVDNSIINATDFDDATKKVRYFRNIIGARLADGYGCKKGLLNSYQRFSRYESCFPSTIDEKSAYVPTANLTEVESGYDYEDGTITISGEYSDGTVGDLLTIPNPCSPFEQLGLNWKPTLLVGVFKTTYNTTNGTVEQYGPCGNVTFNAEFTIPVTFKSQKGDR